MAANALHSAVRAGSVAAVEGLLTGAGGADPDGVDDDGWSALVIACLKRHNGVVKLLLEHGANPNLMDGKGHLPLNCCCLEPHGNLAAAKMLVEAGADVDRADADIGTPLIKASQSSLPEIVELLLKAGADPNKTFEGQTALRHAIHMGCGPAMRLLLEAGADTSKLTRLDVTPKFKQIQKEVEAEREKREMEVATLTEVLDQRADLPYLPNEIGLAQGAYGLATRWFASS